MPTSVVIHEVGIDSLSEQQKKSIDKILDIEKVRKFYNPFDIECFHNGALRAEFNSEDISNFKKTVVDLVLANPGLMIRHRIQLFLSMANIYQSHTVFFDDLRANPKQFPVLVKTIGQGEHPYALGGGGTQLLSFLSNAAINDFIIAIPFKSLLMPLLFSLWLLLRCELAWKIVAVLQLSRLPVFLLFAPAAYFKYVYSMMVFFVLLFPLFLLRHLDRKSSGQSR